MLIYENNDARTRVNGDAYVRRHRTILWYETFLWALQPEHELKVCREKRHESQLQIEAAGHMRLNAIKNGLVINVNILKVLDSYALASRVHLQKMYFNFFHSVTQ
jgi:hypothetical protein